jgi:glycosyltransferase involved in cell wall biosynthesis
VPEDRVTLLPPGIDLSLFRPRDRTGDGDPSRLLNVIHVGWDFRRKGGDLLVALAREEEFRDVRFHFVTSAPTDSMPDNAVIHRAVEPNSARLIDLYAQADVFVLPTRADTYSMVALEAMAMGLPVIISRVGGISDIVAEGETGYIIPPDDLDVLRDRLRRLKHDRTLRLSMGARGRKRVEQRYDLAHHTEIVLDLLSQAARSRAERRKK